MNELTKAASDVLAERERQIKAEGWTPEHDDAHGDGSMATAAACYALSVLPDRVSSESVAKLWPWTGWAWKWWKPKDKRRNLVKAGALILAEIERLDRASASTPDRTLHTESLMDQLAARDAERPTSNWNTVRAVIQHISDWESSTFAWQEDPDPVVTERNRIAATEAHAAECLRRIRATLALGVGGPDGH